MPLTDTFVRQVKSTGRPSGDSYADGGGMYLLVKLSGKYWRMDYRFAGKRKTLALGVYPDVPLAKARKKRDEARQLLADEQDPAVHKRAAKLALETSTQNTFEKVAESWLVTTAKERKKITQDKITNWLAKDIYPYIGKMPISSIGPRDVLTVARKMEERGVNDSARRLVQICGQVFRYAVAEGSAERDVTVDIKGALQKAEKKHFAAITDSAQLAQLLRAIDGYSGHIYASTALKLTPQVFLRPGELRHGEWQEIDFANSEWRISANKMKMDIDHIIPLSTQSLSLLRDIHKLTGHGKYIFPSIRTGERPMSENTINAALRALGYDGKTQTAHGFRATARTILDEILGERVDLIEHQLAHAVKDANGRAYNRTAHLPARRAMMQRWSDYLDDIKNK